MNLEATKIELIKMLVRTSKVSVLEKIKVILENDQEELTQDDFKIIDIRRENNLKNNSKSYSWEEVRKIVQQRN
uniref:hypothetical protein n=1 Tax=Flavobacterium sp. TaxID=239 RepID=UPI00404B0EB9